MEGSRASHCKDPCSALLHAAFFIHVTVCNASGTSDGDYVGTLTSLFKDIAAAVEENEEFVAASFGQGALLKFVRRPCKRCPTTRGCLCPIWMHRSNCEDKGTQRII